MDDLQRHCAFCDHALGVGVPDAPLPGRRHAYDPEQGRLWEICPACQRWNPVPLALRWETLERWERAVRDEGRTLIDTKQLALIRVRDGEVVRVGRPPMTLWGGWRYGETLPALSPKRRGWLRRLIEGLPPPPLEGYDPYGLGGPMGGVAGSRGPARWLGSPFLSRAQPLTMVFTSIPLAPRCPSCSQALAIQPWAFHLLAFVQVGQSEAPDGLGVEVPCGSCGDWVLLPLDAVRPALRLGLTVLDPVHLSRPLGEAAGAGLDAVGGPHRLLEGMAKIRAPLGDLAIQERVALGMALDARAEVAALEAEWKRAEEIIGILDRELTDVPGFDAFRRRILDEGSGG